MKVLHGSEYDYMNMNVMWIMWLLRYMKVIWVCDRQRISVHDMSCMFEKWNLWLKRQRKMIWMKGERDMNMLWMTWIKEKIDGMIIWFEIDEWIWDVLHDW